MPVASRGNAWAVGGVFAAGAGHPLIEHWNGGSWRLVPSPAPAGSVLYGVAATSARNAWAVGTIRTGPPRAHLTPLIVHWNGK